MSGTQLETEFQSNILANRLLLPPAVLAFCFNFLSGLKQAECYPATVLGRLAFLPFLANASKECYGS